jgi:hypothetical protein
VPVEAGGAGEQLGGIHDADYAVARRAMSAACEDLWTPASDDAPQSTARRAGFATAP